MNKTEIIKTLQSRVKELKKLVSKISKHSALSAEGTINVKIQKNSVRFFCRKKGELTYLGADKKDEIRKFCTKLYAIKLKKAAETEASQISQCLKILNQGEDADVEVVYSQLPECIRENTNPSIITDDGYAEKWQAEKYQNRWEGRGFKYETPRGEKVRSKSEWMIASMLADAGVPYRYEETVGLHELYGGAFHPDFTVLNKRTRKEYYWEHFGRMDDPKYVEESFMPKIIDYYTFGFIPGEKLLMTFESKDHPFDIMQVRRLIETYLT